MLLLSCLTQEYFTSTTAANIMGEKQFDNKQLISFPKNHIEQENNVFTRFLISSVHGKNILSCALFQFKQGSICLLPLTALC